MGRLTSGMPVRIYLASPAGSFDTNHSSSSKKNIIVCLAYRLSRRDNLQPARRVSFLPTLFHSTPSFVSKLPSSSLFPLWRSRFERKFLRTRGSSLGPLPRSRLSCQGCNVDGDAFTSFQDFNVELLFLHPLHPRLRGHVEGFDSESCVDNTRYGC